MNVCQIFVLFQIYIKHYRALFPLLHSLIETQGGSREIKTIMQTQNLVEGFHNCLKFSHPPEYLDEAM